MIHQSCCCEVCQRLPRIPVHHTTCKLPNCLIGNSKHFPSIFLWYVQHKPYHMSEQDQELINNSIKLIISDWTEKVISLYFILWWLWHTRGREWGSNESACWPWSERQIKCRWCLKGTRRWQNNNLLLINFAVYFGYAAWCRTYFIFQPFAVRSGFMLCLVVIYFPTDLAGIRTPIILSFRNWNHWDWAKVFTEWNIFS